MVSSTAMPSRGSGSACRQLETPPSSCSSLPLSSPSLSQPRQEEASGPAVVPPPVMSNAVAAARQALEQMCRDSAIFQSNPLHSIPRMEPENLLVGNKLGQGGYCTVHQVTHHDGDQMSTYALKRLKPLVRKYPSEFRYGLMDLAVEAAFLANLQHPNIIRIHGMSSQAFSDERDSDNEGADGEELFGKELYLVLDLLSESLKDRILRWKTTHHFAKARKKKGTTTRKTGGGGAGNSGTLRSLLLLQSNQEERRLRTERLLERIRTVLPIAKAMEYLHSLGFMYRDLKPDNVGFDRTTGVIKLFDFGMASTSRVRRDPSGSRRYMAPETAQRQFYTNSVDVYSFAIVVWEVCSAVDAPGQRPFDDLNRDQHYQKVIMGTTRPKMEHWWPRDLQRLLRHCWCKTPIQRLPFVQVVPTLEGIVDRNSG